MRPRMVMNALNSRNHLATLLPTHSNAWWPLVEDIFTSPAAYEVRTQLLAQAVQSGECRYLSVDGTFRVCLPLLGQAKFNDPASVRACAPFQDITRSIRTCVSMPLFT